MDILGPTGSTLPPRLSHRSRAKELPSLEDVRSDVEYLRREKEFVRRLDTDEGLLEWMAETDYPMDDFPIAFVQANVWVHFIPALLKFCRNVMTEDVPEDILQEYMWMQRKNIRFFTDASPDEWRFKVSEDHGLGPLELDPEETTNTVCFAVAFTSSGADDGSKILYFRQNVIDCLLSPQVNQVQEALSEYEKMVEEYTAHLRSVDSPNRDAPWLERSMVFIRYAEARMWCNLLNQDTRILLERCLEGMTRGTQKIDDLPWHLIVVRMSLALVLQALNVEPEIQKSHVDWTVHHLRKRPHYKDRVVQFLSRSGQLSHPVLAELGTDWLEDKSVTQRQELRQERRCAHCERERPVVQKLKVCTKCKRAYYCSEECKEANRSVHQRSCSEWAAIRSRVSRKGIKQMDNAITWEMTPGLAPNVEYLTELPSLADVRSDAEKRRDILQDASEDTDDGVLRHLRYAELEPATRRFIAKFKTAPAAIREFIVWSARIRHLMDFCTCVVVEDVPEDLLSEFMWAERKAIRLYSETSGEERTTYGLAPAIDSDYTTHYWALMHRKRLSMCLMSPTVDAPGEAVPLLKDAQDRHIAYLNATHSPLASTPWLETPLIYIQYAEARVLSNLLDLGTKDALMHALEAVTGSKEHITDVVTHIVLVRMSLALVFQVLDIEPDAQKMHTEWAKHHLRKRPQLKETIARYLKRPCQLVHPVYIALGEEWFEDRALILFRREERRAGELCVHCGRGKPAVERVFRCGGCQRIYYCSVFCQKEDRPYHRDECEEEMRKQERERTKVEGGEVSHKWAKQVEEEHKWWNGTKYNDLEAMVHALSLPLDLSRTRTHIFFRVFKFDPHARRIRAGSRPLYIARCGVFKIDDVIKDIMVLSPKLGPDRNKAKSALAAMVESAPWGQVNILVATWNHVGDKDGSGSVSYVSLPEDQIRRTTYDSNWRERINRGRSPPERLIPLSGAADAELDYCESTAVSSSRLTHVPLISSQTVEAGLRRMAL
ncbi:hypothetical protein EIP91_009503 [Steccherinum ochraceum]|uniref:MYND-type domain-containing protein n=1 Tax=Steccherinum ochraceum TaxID=92696 RepID=A0A4R0R492_9APHY|nr:hypothetical protein EIP91_009503 [Steccherinum ochraceum]